MMLMGIWVDANEKLAKVQSFGWVYGDRSNRGEQKPIAEQSTRSVILHGKIQLDLIQCLRRPKYCQSKIP